MSLTQVLARKYKVKANDASVILQGDDWTSTLADFIKENDGLMPDEIKALKHLPVGGTMDMGVHAGNVTIKRIA